MAVPAHILLVEDDPHFRAYLINLLREHIVSVAQSVPQARYVLDQAKTATGREVDLILLDWTLNDHLGRPYPESGFDFLVSLRRERNPVNIIMISGVLDSRDKVLALEEGADDYITKPINDQNELLARIKGALRRSSGLRLHPTALSLVTFNGWIFDTAGHELISPDGGSVYLSASEATLLATFVAKPQTIIDRPTLARSVFGDAADYEKRSIDNLMVDLRKKLGNDQIIRAIRRHGYLFAAKVEAFEKAT